MTLYIDTKEARFAIEEIIRQNPELADDDVLRADMLEGSTDFHDLLSRCVSAYQEAKANAEAVKALEAKYKARRDALERRADASKALMKSLMEAADTRKVSLPEATVSITKARTSCVITDADQLPQGYFQTIRKPLTADVKKALEAGEAIPGAELEFGEEGVMVRT